MTAIDYSIVGLYFAFMLWVGWQHRRRNHTMDDFLLGGRRMKSLPVALSLFVSWFSIISYTAIPGELIQHGPMIWSGLLAAPLGLWFVGWKVIPRLLYKVSPHRRQYVHMGVEYRMKIQFGRSRNITSAYEILGECFGEPVARLASTLFLLMRVAWMAMIVHIASTVIVAPLLGDSSAITGFCLVGVTVAYSLGGFRAVVLTDCIQAGIMFGGAIVIILISQQHVGGLVRCWPTEWPAHWPIAWEWSPLARVSLPATLIGAFCLGVCVKTGDQMNVQRFLAVPNIRASRRVLLLGFGFDVLLTGLLALVGLSLLTAHGASPDADKVLPRLVGSGLPMGCGGLVVAALLAAAMSSISSGLNACVSTVASDWRQPSQDKGCLSTRLAEKANVITPDWSSFSVLATVVLGIIVFILSQVIGIVEGNLIELCYKVVNLLATPLAGLVLTALFLPRTKVVAVWVGSFACLAVVVYVTYYSPITFLLASPLGLAVQLTITFVSRRKT